MKSQTRESRGVALPEGESGSQFLFRVVREVSEQFDADLRSAEWPGDRRVFRTAYGDALARFESARVSSPRRAEIARALIQRTLDALLFTDDGGTRPLTTWLAQSHEPPTLRTRVLSGKPGWSGEIGFEGRAYRGADARSLIDSFHAQHQMTDAAQRALRWAHDNVQSHKDNALSLQGEHFALLGAAAELAPTRHLLAAGATVLWIDRVSPEKALGDAIHSLAGTLVTADDANANDLLTHPHRAAAAVRRFAEMTGGPVHVGMFAYAPGGGRELRLAAAMDALVRSLGPKVVRSVALLVSPTSPAEAQPEDQAHAESRLTTRPFWQGLLSRTPLLRGPGHARATPSSTPVARAVVSLQGPGYQAAQYLTKVASAESLAVDGLDISNPGSVPVRVSASVAGITRTRSLEHPLFLAAFQAAPTFGIRIFESSTTRALSTLMLTHDLLSPSAPTAPGQAYETPAARAAALRALQVHGGVFNLPWQFEHAVRAAAVLGLVTGPGVLFRKPARSSRG